MNKIRRFDIDFDGEEYFNDEGDFIYYKDYNETVKKLEAENERLREALQYIADGTGQSSWTDQVLARQALGEK